MNAPESRRTHAGALATDGREIAFSVTLSKVQRMPGIAALRIELPEGLPLKHIEVDYAEVMLALDRAKDALMADTMQLTVDAGVPEGWCGICRRELELHEANMVIGTTATHPKGELISVTICRPCLAEHVPDMLAAVEAAVEGRVDEDVL